MTGYIVLFEFTWESLFERDVGASVNCPVSGFQTFKVELEFIDNWFKSVIPF